MPDIKGIENDVFWQCGIRMAEASAACLEGLKEGGTQIPEGATAPLMSVVERLIALLPDEAGEETYNRQREKRERASRKRAGEER